MQCTIALFLACIACTGCIDASCCLYAQQRPCLCVGHDRKPCKTIQQIEMLFAAHMYAGPNGVHMGASRRIRLNDPSSAAMCVVAAVTAVATCLARSTNLPERLYVLLALISSFFLYFFYYEQSYLSIYWTDFHDLFTKW